MWKNLEDHSTVDVTVFVTLCHSLIRIWIIPSSIILSPLPCISWLHQLPICHLSCLFFSLSACHCLFLSQPISISIPSNLFFPSILPCLCLVRLHLPTAFCQRRLRCDTAKKKRCDAIGIGKGWREKKKILWSKGLWEISKSALPKNARDCFSNPTLQLPSAHMHRCDCWQGVPLE